MFGKKPELYLPSGKTSYKTLTGCLCTLLTFAAIIAFGGLLIMKNILNKEEFSVQSKLSPDYFGIYSEFPTTEAKD